MSIGRIGGGKAVVLKLLVEKIISLETSGELTSGEAKMLIDDVYDRMNHGRPLAQLPKVVDGGFVRTEDIDELIDSANLSYAYITAEMDSLTAVARMISYLVNGRIDEALASVQSAGAAANNLQAYIGAKRGGFDGIAIDLDNDIYGSFKNWNGAIISNTLTSKPVSPSGMTIRTNGQFGNMLELEETPQEKDLTYSEINFVDPNDTYADRNSIIDDVATTLFEIEQTLIDEEAKVDDYIPLQVRASTADGYIDIDYDRAPNNGELWAEFIFDIPNNVSIIEVIPSYLNTGKITVDTVSVSSDGEIFHEVDRDFALTPEANMYLGKTGSNAGVGVFFVPPITATKALVRLKTQTAYKTLLAHVHEYDENDNRIVPEPWDRLDRKTSFFGPSSDHKGNHKEVRALPATRWSISLRSVNFIQTEFAKTSMFETGAYSLGRPCERVAISVDEEIPQQCSIKYEISPDVGKTWLEISPIERSGGKEVIVFGAETTANPNLSQTGFFATDEPVTSIMLRATMNSAVVSTPVIRKIVIQPVLARS